MASFEQLIKKKREELSSAWTAFFSLLRAQIVPVPEVYVKQFYVELERPPEQRRVELLETLEDVYQFLQELLSYETRDLDKKQFGSLLSRADTYLKKLSSLREQVDFLNPEFLRDKLTNLWNEKALRLFYTIEITPRIYEEDFVVVLFDINDFKTLQKTHGEKLAGECLKIFAEFLRNNFKGKDFIARLKDDQFVVVMRDTIFDKAKAFLETIYREEIPCRVKKERHTFNIVLTFSVGFTNILGSDTLEEVLSRVRQSLYLSKDTEKLQGIRV